MMRRVLSLSVLACLAFAPACSDPAASGTVDGADAVGDASGGDATDLTDADDSATGTATGTATTATTDASVNVTFDIDDSDPDISGRLDVLVGTFPCASAGPGRRRLHRHGGHDVDRLGACPTARVPDLVGFAETTAAGDRRAGPGRPHQDGRRAAAPPASTPTPGLPERPVGGPGGRHRHAHRVAGATACSSWSPRQLPAARPEPALPGFAEGDTVAIHAGGDVYARLHLAAPGVAQLVITSSLLTLERGQALALRWTRCRPRRPRRRST
ncbi:MAG: hypothetical protein U1F43_25070 [Myxococcota bacterium]